MQARFNFGEYLTHQGTRLNLFTRALVDEDVPSILCFLERFPAVTSLNLENQKLLSKAALSMLLACRTLREVNLSYIASNVVTSDMLAEIVQDVLSRNTGLRILHLNHNHFDDNHMSDIATGLNRNIHLTHLFMGNNLVAIAAVGVLFETLRFNSCLQVLHLNHNKIDCHGADYFAKAYANNMGLIEINLDGNAIADKGAICIAEQLRKNNSRVVPAPLAIISLRNNPISDAGVKSFTDVFNAGPSIAKVDMSNMFVREVLERQVQQVVAVAEAPHNDHDNGNNNNVVVLDDDAQSVYKAAPFYVQEQFEGAVPPTAPTLDWFNDEIVVREMAGMEANAANHAMYQAVPRVASPVVVPVHNHHANLWNAPTSESDEELDFVSDQEEQEYFNFQF